MAIIINNDNQFAVKNFLTLPLGGDRFLISLGGVALVNFTGQQGPDWRRDTAIMYLSVRDALNLTGRTPSPGFELAFAPEQWTQLVTPNAFTDLNQAINFGVAVDDFQIDLQGGQPQTSVRVDVSIAARDIDTYLYRIGYMLLLIGRVVEIVDTNPV